MGVCLYVKLMSVCPLHFNINPIFSHTQLFTHHTLTHQHIHRTYLFQRRVEGREGRSHHSQVGSRVRLAAYQLRCWFGSHLLNLQIGMRHGFVFVSHGLGVVVWGSSARRFLVACILGSPFLAHARMADIRRGGLSVASDFLGLLHFLSPSSIGVGTWLPLRSVALGLQYSCGGRPQKTSLACWVCYCNFLPSLS